MEGEEASCFGSLEDRFEVGESLERELREGKTKIQAYLGVRPSRGGRTATQSRTTLGCFDPNTAAALDQPHHKSGDHASCRRLFSLLPNATHCRERMLQKQGTRRQ